MLVLSRKSGETVMIGEDIFITVGRIRADHVRLVVRAPLRVMETLSGRILERHRNYALVLIAEDRNLGLGDDVTIVPVDIRSDRVRLGIQSPPEVPVHRQEVYEAIHRAGSGPENPDHPPDPM